MADNNPSEPPFTLRSNSAWDLDEVRAFLREARIPLRLGIESGSSPLIVALWFELRDDALWCAAHRDALVVQRLQASPVCAIDISTNDIPYRGVRGAGTVTCLPEAGGATLDRLIERYLGDTDNRLARWLQSRRDEEIALKITPQWLTSWDFSSRMSDIEPSGG